MRSTDFADINFYWETENPTKHFWSFVGAAGSIVTGATPKKVEGAARACFDEAAHGHGIGEYDRDEIYMDCLLTKDGGGTFAVSMYRRGHDGR